MAERERESREVDCGVLWSQPDITGGSREVDRVDFSVERCAMKPSSLMSNILGFINVGPL